MNLTLTQKSVIELIKEDEAYANYFFSKYDKDELFFALKEEGFFDPKNNPGPKKVKDGYQIPEWNVLTYLEKISKKTRSLDSNLIEIIQEASLFQDKNGEYIDNDRTRWFFVKILINIPLSTVPLSFFDEVIPTWLESKFSLILPGSELVEQLLPTYLKQVNDSDDIKKVEKLVNTVLSTREIKLENDVFGKSEELKTKIEDHWIEEAFLKKDCSLLIAEKCTTKPIYDLANVIKNAFNKRYEKQDYSSLWLNDLTVEEHRSPHDAEYFLAQILRKLILGKIDNDQDASNDLISKFLSDEYPHYLFKRLALLILANSWTHSNNLFDQILDDKENYYFDTEAFQPELIYLLSKNAQYLTKQQRSKIKSIIQKGPTKNLPQEREKEYVSYWKQLWCKALIELPEFKKLYGELKKSSGRDVDLPSKRKLTESSEVSFDKSPVSPEQFLEKTNEEIVHYINNYKPTGDFYQFSPEGVYKAFQSAVELNPEKFCDDIKPFSVQNYHILSCLFNGLEEAWKQKKCMSWENVIGFILELIGKEWFWKPAEKDRSIHVNYFSWSISAIADLLQEGCKTDDWAFPESEHKNVEKIIAIFVSKIEFDEKSYQRDGMSLALNSNWGKIITALIYLGLRQARISDKRKENKKSKWSLSLKKSFEETLNKGIFEAYTLLGHYFPNIHYVDKDWSISKAQAILEDDDGRHFATFMEGYLYHNSIYRPIFIKLRKHYERALTTSFKESRVKERLVQHIAIWYLRGIEKINKGSLIGKMFSSGNFDQIREFVEFLWHERDHILDDTTSDQRVKKEQSEFKKRVLEFWVYTAKVIKERSIYSEDERKILGELSKLLIYLDKITKEYFDLLMLSAPYVTEDFDSPYFIEYLNDQKSTGIKKQSAKYVGSLFLEMLNNAKGRIPDYKWENIVEIVEYLYEVGEKDTNVKNMADAICDFYAKHRNYGLRAVYEKNVTK